MAYTLPQLIYAAIDYHIPKSMQGDEVACNCGFRGSGVSYLEHIALSGAGEITNARYKVVDRHGAEVRAR